MPFPVENVDFFRGIVHAPTGVFVAFRTGRTTSAEGRVGAKDFRVGAAAAAVAMERPKGKRDGMGCGAGEVPEVCVASVTEGGEVGVEERVAEVKGVPDAAGRVDEDVFVEGGEVGGREGLEAVKPTARFEAGDSTVGDGYGGGGRAVGLGLGVEGEDEGPRPRGKIFGGSVGGVD